MENDRMQRALESEEAIWQAKPYSELSRMSIDDVITYEKGDGKDWYEVEIEVYELNDVYVHVGIAVDDGGMTTFFPKSTSIIVRRDGRQHSAE